MSSTTRPEVVDDHGLEHRYGCKPDTVRTDRHGWTLARCRRCGAVQIRRRGAWPMSRLDQIRAEVYVVVERHGQRLDSGYVWNVERSPDGKVESVDLDDRGPCGHPRPSRWWPFHPSGDETWREYC